MNGSRQLMWMLVVVMLSLPALAADGCFTGENCTWWAYDGTGQTTAVNITIQYPNGTEFTADTPMVARGGGSFSYTTVFNTTGNYNGIYEFYNSTGANFYDGAESKEITEEFSVLTFTVLFGLLAITAGLAFIAKDMMTKPTGETNNKIMRMIDGKNVGVFIYLLASWGLVAVMGFLTYITEGQSYYRLIETIYITLGWVLAAFNMAYIAIFVLHVINQKMFQSIKGGRYK